MIGPLPISTAINNSDTLMGSSLFSSLSSLATSSPSLPFTSANLMHPHEQNHHPSSIINQNDSSSTITTSSNGLKKSSSTQSNHKVQYTFSISTPDTLRSRQKKSSSSSCNNSSLSSSSNNVSSKPPHSPVELVRLYPNEHTVSVKNHQKENHHQEVATPKSPTPSISSRASSVISTPTMACQVFCDKLQEEVCTNSFDHLLSEPLFDLTTGSLNESIIIHPSNNQYNNSNNDHGDNNDDDDDQNTNNNDKMDDTSKSLSKKYLSSQEIWKRLSEHPHFRQYSTDQLLKMVKSLAKCTHMGPVLTEQDIHFIMDKMNQGIL